LLFDGNRQLQKVFIGRLELAVKLPLSLLTVESPEILFIGGLVYIVSRWNAEFPGAKVVISRTEIKAEQSNIILCSVTTSTNSEPVTNNFLHVLITKC